MCGPSLRENGTANALGNDPEHLSDLTELTKPKQKHVSGNAEPAFPMSVTTLVITQQ